MVAPLNSPREHFDTISTQSHAAGALKPYALLTYCSILDYIGESLFTIFCFISIGLSLSDSEEANKIKFLNIERA